MLVSRAAACLRGGVRLMISSMRHRWPWWAALAAIAAVGMALRLWGSASTPMWLDEAYSAYAAEQGLAFLWQVVPAYETHPPFYYTLLWLWTRPFGEGLVAMRALGWVAALASFPAMALAMREATRIARAPTAAGVIAAAALFALAPYSVEMAREVRPYPLMILIYALALWAILALRRRVVAGGPVIGWAYLFYLACLALLLWLHNLGPLYAAALGLGCLLATVRAETTVRDWAWLVGGHLLVGLVWLPALLILIGQAPTWVSDTWLKFTPSLLPVRVPLLYAGPGALAALAAAILVVLGVRRLSDADWRAAAILILAAALPVLLSIGLSWAVAPVFIMRTMTPVAVPTILLMALATAGGGNRNAIGLGLLLTGALLAANLGSDMANRASGPPQNWYGAVRWLDRRFQPGDLVVAYPNEGALPFDRAVRDLGLRLPSRPIPTSVPTLSPPPGSWYVSGSRGVPSLDPAHLQAIAADPAMRRVPTVWLLRLGPWAYDKGDVFLREMGAGRHPVGRFRSGPIDIVGLAKD